MVRICEEIKNSRPYSNSSSDEINLSVAAEKRYFQLNYYYFGVRLVGGEEEVAVQQKRLAGSGHHEQQIPLVLNVRLQPVALENRSGNSSTL